MTTLTKAELTEKLITRFNFSKNPANDLVNLLFSEVSNALAEGIEVKISGFGNFELKDKCARPGRNPKTGQDVEICARRVVTFKPGPKLRARLETLSGENILAFKQQQ